MKDTLVFLRHIQDAIGNIEADTGKGKKGFFANRTVQDAVLYNLQIIGEAAGKVSKKVKEAYTDVPWREIIDLRNVIAHEYFGISMEVIWNILEKDLPPLKKQITHIIDHLDSHA